MSKLRTFQEWWDTTDARYNIEDREILAFRAWNAALEASGEYLAAKKAEADKPAPVMDADDWNKIKKEEAGGGRSGRAVDLGLY